MQTITFTCEVITPMFLAGADGTTPELRPASIKGALRFWWRARNGHLVGENRDLTQLKEAEAKIFGGSGEGQGRSKVILQIQEDNLTIEQSNISLTPHHKKGYCLNLNENQIRSNVNTKNCQKWDKNIDACAKARPPKDGYLFGKFTIETRFDSSIISEAELVKVLKLTFLAGGLGKRTRRGFGSLSLELNGKQCFQSKNDVEEFIKELSLPKSSTIDFPYLLSIEIGKEYEAYTPLLEDIGLQSHNYNQRNDLYLGFAKKIKNGNAYEQKRMASSIYVSVFKDHETGKYYPIITTLKTAFEPYVLEAINENIDYTNNRSIDFINSLK